MKKHWTQTKAGKKKMSDAQKLRWASIREEDKATAKAREKSARKSLGEKAVAKAVASGKNNAAPDTASARKSRYQKAVADAVANGEIKVLGNVMADELTRVANMLRRTIGGV